MITVLAAHINAHNPTTLNTRILLTTNVITSMLSWKDLLGELQLQLCGGYPGCVVYA